MTRRVVTVSMDDTLRRVRDIFEHERFHHLVVVEHGRAVGVISDRDLLRNLSPFVGRAVERAQDASTLNKRVHQVMSRRLVSCSPETGLERAAELMLAERVSCLPVLDEHGRCTGIVTLHDLLSWTLTACLGKADACEVRKAA